MEENLTKKQQKELVLEVLKDFKRRQEERKSFDLLWQLNINFLIGNQNCEIGSGQILSEDVSKFYWQEKRVFNHIAPLIESRLARLSEVKPSMIVLPASSEDDDVANAKVCRDILESAASKLDLSKVISKATSWSEVCGTSFYKLVWNNTKGAMIGANEFGQKIYEGDVDIVVCPPFEIYPDSNSCPDINACKSIIHAKCYDVDTIFDLWGEKVRGADIDSFALAGSSYSLGAISNYSKLIKTTKHNQAIVIEKYEKPTKEYPDGRLIIVADDKLLYYGKLPYKNLANGERGFPFIRQISIEQPSLFWGGSVVERLIPVQRAYNAVKNRKHEFMNRASLGVLAVEDGSVDIEALEEDGLAPGKILVYRQGSELPTLLGDDAVPQSFEAEETKLLDEFLNVGGVSDIFGGKSNTTLSKMSGAALQLLVEQEYSRISATGENIKFAVKQIAEHILRLYKQFVVGERASRLIGNNGVSNFFYWSKGNISSDEIIFDTQAENLKSLSQKRNIILDLLEKGLFNDSNGKLTGEMKLKVLDALGFGLWEESLDNNSLQIQKAKRENVELVKDKKIPRILEIHDHDLHIKAHVAFMLSKEFEQASKDDAGLEKIMLEHIKEHKQFLKKQKDEQILEGE